MSVENVIDRLATVIQANIAAAFAAEDARMNDGVVLPVPTATTGYFKHAAAMPEVTVVPAIHIVATGGEVIPWQTGSEDDDHEITVIYSHASADAAELDKVIFRATYALRRMLVSQPLDDDLAAAGSPTGFSGILVRNVTAFRYMQQGEVGRGGSTLKSGAIVLRCRERLDTLT